MKFVSLVIVTLLVAATISGQIGGKKKIPAQKTGTVSGRVFLITNGGDLKPARMAKVQLFGDLEADRFVYPMYVWLQRNQAERMNDDTERTEEDTERRIAKLNAGVPLDALAPLPTDQERCVETLVASEAAVKDTLERAKDENKRAQIMFTETDEEEGRFSFEGVQAGDYVLVVRGRAGVHEADWIQNFSLLPGESKTIKLSEPTHSCAMINP
jgi:hypothetical protein